MYEPPEIVLFFDTFIVSGDGEPDLSAADQNYLKYNKKRHQIISRFRDSKPAYRFVEKITVVKYSLASYAHYPWRHVVIRYELEDPSRSAEFEEYCRDLFPRAEIVNQRSSTAAQYVSALAPLRDFGNPWIFFSPNNDHPMVCHPSVLELTLSSAQDIEQIIDADDFCILFSHFQEARLSLTPLRPLWGYYARNYIRRVFSTEWGALVRSPKYLIDSISIFRLEKLIEIFSSTDNTGRVIRLEDSEHYLSPRELLLFVPSHEICRHYDSYWGEGITRQVQPLFVPRGFFARDINITYGERDDGSSLTINPSIDYRDSCPNSPDLSLLLSEIPYFWRDRISSIKFNMLEPPRLRSRAFSGTMPFNHYQEYINSTIFPLCITKMLLDTLGLFIRFVHLIIDSPFLVGRFLKRSLKILLNHVK